MRITGSIIIHTTFVDDKTHFVHPPENASLMQWRNISSLGFICQTDKRPSTFHVCIARSQSQSCDQPQPQCLVATSGVIREPRFSCA